MVTLGIVTTAPGGLILRTLADHRAFTLRACCQACPAIPAGGASKGTVALITRPIEGVGS